MEKPVETPVEAAEAKIQAEPSKSAKSSSKREQDPPVALADAQLQSIFAKVPPWQDAELTSPFVRDEALKRPRFDGKRCTTCCSCSRAADVALVKFPNVEQPPPTEEQLLQRNLEKLELFSLANVRQAKKKPSRKNVNVFDAS